MPPIPFGSFPLLPRWRSTSKRRGRLHHKVIFRQSICLCLVLALLIRSHRASLVLRALDSISIGDRSISIRALDSAGLTTKGSSSEQVPFSQQQLQEAEAITNHTHLDQPPKAIQPSPSLCRYSTTEDFTQKFSKEFFEEMQNANPLEHQWWLEFSATPLGKAINTVDTADCEIQWKRSVLGELDGFYLVQYLQALRLEGGSYAFEYVDNQPDRPSILCMGDSNSQGVWVWTQIMFGALANVHSAPGIAFNFELYDDRLDRWLGNQPWDLIQFNIGQHYYHNDLEEYRNGLKRVVMKLRQHSPNAHIVFATATPSPFDTEIPLANTTEPTIEGSAVDRLLEGIQTKCKDATISFRPRGFLPQLNEVAKALSHDMGFEIVDRYNAILPHMEEYSIPCDVHFQTEGYIFLAKTEWATFSRLLGLPALPPEHATSATNVQ